MQLRGRQVMGYSSTHLHRIEVPPVTGFLLWLLLLVVCWPLALLALVLYPIVWLLTLPLRLVGITVGAVFALLAAMLMLPARLLRGRPV